MRIVFIMVVAPLMFSLTLCGQDNKPDFEDPIQVLVFSRTEGFRHNSIAEGVKMIYVFSESQNWIVTASEDPAVFNDAFLDGVDVVVFLNPSGNALDEKQQAAFEKLMRQGKGMVGIHAAADFEYNWQFYGDLVGAYFKNHPPAQEATVNFENLDHPAMKPFSGMDSYTTFDEWYTFRSNPRNKVNVLATLDESSIKKSSGDEWKMDDHPLIWWQETDGIRSFYTGYGHTPEAFQDQKIADHIKNAINWAAWRLN